MTRRRWSEPEFWIKQVTAELVEELQRYAGRTITAELADEIEQVCFDKLCRSLRDTLGKPLTTEQTAILRDICERATADFRPSPSGAGDRTKR